MSEPTKTNAEILANPQVFLEMYERAKERFRQIDGVAGVGFGQKQTDAQNQDTITIVVFVREKKAVEALPPNQPYPQRSPSSRLRVARRSLTVSAVYTSPCGSSPTAPTRPPRQPAGYLRDHHVTRRDMRHDY